MNSTEIFDAASKSRLLSDPYVQKIWNLIGDRNLFNKPPEHLKALRKSLMRDALEFQSKHSDYCASLLERLNIQPNNAELEDLAKLAMPSDMLRGEGHKQFLIKGVEPGGEYFSSSGTTGKEPIKIYRSPLDLAMMIKANTSLFEYIYGDILEEGKGVALFMAAPELRHKFSFVAFVHLILEHKNIELLYGMDLVQDDGKKGSQWQRLEPNREKILKFFKSKAEPKLFFTPPAGVYMMAQRFDKMNILRKIGYKLVTGTPPINLGKRGVVVTGGGSMGHSLPTYDDIVSLSRKYFISRDKNGDDIPAPFIDVLGMTEALTALIDNYDFTQKVPHPLSQVFLLDPRTFEFMHEDGKEGVLGVFNPFVTSWLEVFCPGDLMSSIPSKGYYGKEYKYARRFTVEEAGSSESMWRDSRK